MVEQEVVSALDRLSEDTLRATLSATNVFTAVLLHGASKAQLVHFYKTAITSKSGEYFANNIISKQQLDAAATALNQTPEALKESFKTEPLISLFKPLPKNVLDSFRQSVRAVIMACFQLYLSLALLTSLMKIFFKRWWTK